jgi:hypothetical protein
MCEEAVVKPRAQPNLISPRTTELPIRTVMPFCPLPSPPPSINAYLLPLLHGDDGLYLDPIILLYPRCNEWMMSVYRDRLEAKRASYTGYRIPSTTTMLMRMHTSILVHHDLPVVPRKAHHILHVVYLPLGLCLLFLYARLHHHGITSPYASTTQATELHHV